MKPMVDRFAVGFFALYALVSFFVPACKEQPPPEPPVVIIAVDGGSAGWEEPADGSSGAFLNPGCAKACSNLRARGCLDGFRRPGEDSCYVVCKRAEESMMDLKTGCVAKAETIAAIRACGTYRCK